jgi:Na+/melibiose symporter-like transporter
MAGIRNSGMRSTTAVLISKGCIALHILIASFFLISYHYTHSMDDREHALMFLLATIMWVLVLAIWSRGKDDEHQ